jgi:hypothetical protein
MRAAEAFVEKGLDTGVTPEENLRKRSSTYERWTHG